jgi:2-keto-4-pentenoate hydratase/2-oxohepta-3-ene-1,7-dioic acid hydratase in catechol pathway
MRLLSLAKSNGCSLGIDTPRGVLDVAAAQDRLGGRAPTDVHAAIEAGPNGQSDLAALLDRAAQEPSLLLDPDQLSLAPCVPAPGKIICVGLNYRKHALETGAPIPEVPVLFAKFPNALAAAGESVPLPSVASQYDYEVELVAVIGRRARNVSEAGALDHVYGYCVGNDLSARDLQFRTSQWLLGKILDRFLPLGPWLVTADEVGDPQALRLRTWVNGELRQDSNTADMIFSVAQLVSFISRVLTLDPGDLIVTGTPEGVILGRPEPERVWLKAGDELSLEIERLGCLSNRLVVDV